MRFTMGNVCRILNINTMKTIKYIIIAILIQSVLFSCQPKKLDEDGISPIHATGDEIDDLAEPDEDN